MAVGFVSTADRVIDEDSDHLIQLHIPQKLLNFDLQLFGTKWFDYRRMTPLEATVEYMRSYVDIYRVIYAREMDSRAAPHITPVHPSKLLIELAGGKLDAKRKMTAFWRGRQVADAIGMPYRVFIELAFTARMRAWQRPYLPQPQHLYGERDVERVQARWEEQQASMIYMPEDSAFNVDSYIGMPYQDDFHEWCFKQALLRGDHAYALAQMIRNQQLPLEKVRARIEPALFERVISEIENPI